MVMSVVAERLSALRSIKPRTAAAIVGVAVLIALIILGARGLRHIDAVHSFMQDYPGATLTDAPVGFPVWVNVLHGLNALFMIFIITSGIKVRTNQRPRQFYTRTLGPHRKPSKKISMDIWLHLTVDSLWVLTGILFYILLFATGQWRRIIPTSWDVFPNAASAIIQYASFDWPSEHGWIVYNGIQLLTYFLVVFIAAPLSLITGLRMSPSWPTEGPLAKFPVELARKVHFPNMVFFVGFIVVHVILVLFTGAQHNLNHMFASRDDGSWLGVIFFIVTVVASAALFVGARPTALRAIASLTGKVSR
jgi:thiosulfate reductase cytochrome b subunit